MTHLPNTAAGPKLPKTSLIKVQTWKTFCVWVSYTLITSISLCVTLNIWVILLNLSDTVDLNECLRNSHKHKISFLTLSNIHVRQRGLCYSKHKPYHLILYPHAGGCLLFIWFGLFKFSRYNNKLRPVIGKFCHVINPQSKILE